MIIMLQNHVQWILSLHIMAFISWMAGLFYLPRLFVYHTQINLPEGRQDMPADYARFCVMERKLLRQIMTPAMILTIVTGGIMAALPGLVDWSAPWWWIKIISVLGLCAFHGACAAWRHDFAEKRNMKSERFYRFANEIPTILMMLVVIMIIVRP